jgi:carbon monoxide dehydrogenase subunit G
MEIENEFTVAAPIERVWHHVLDVEKVAPCMPGAELTDIVDDRTWKGKTNVKIGPVSLSFAGTVVMEERDDHAHRVRLNAKGTETRGKGAASAVVVSRMEEVEGGTKVTIETDLTITGAVAQYGRGMMLDISKRLTQEFARCLEADIVAGESEQGSPAGSNPGTAEVREAAAPPKPVKGLRLGVWALWRVVVRFFQRLFGGKSD